jgi:hypothetical protein
MNGDLTLCGWRVRSALALPELLPWTGDDRPADVEIVFDAIREPGAAPVFALPHSKLWAGGAYLLDMHGIGKFHVEGGRRVVVEPVQDTAESELRAFILSTVLGVLCHQRGLLPIHASAVRIDGRAVLFAGISGIGKSTLAAALGQRGHILLADDVSAFDPQTATILPAFPQRKLATDSLEALQLDHSGMLPNRPGQPKFRVPVAADFATTALQPSAVYILQRYIVGEPDEFAPLPPAMAMAQLDKMIFRRVVGRRIQPGSALFQSITRLAQTAPVHLLSRHKALPLSGLDAFAERVEAHARGQRPCKPVRT